MVIKKSIKEIGFIYELKFSDKKYQNFVLHCKCYFLDSIETKILFANNTDCIQFYKYNQRVIRVNLPRRNAIIAIEILLFGAGSGFDWLAFVHCARKTHRNIFYFTHLFYQTSLIYRNIISGQIQLNLICNRFFIKTLSKFTTFVQKNQITTQIND